MTQQSGDRAQYILRMHGKSFYWASLFLGRNIALNAARLYRFCRTVDDLVDMTPHSVNTLTILNKWQSDLTARKSSDPGLRDILNLTDEIGLDTLPLKLLIDGVISDLYVVKIKDESALINYCYLVAGTVGVMMSTLLDAKDSRAKAFAIDLGIAMQLTNILRDVAEDTSADRQYIPCEWLPINCRLTPANYENIKPALKRLFDLSQKYYASGYAGLNFLPKRCHLSISIAARLYQEIGLLAKKSDFQVWKKRIFVSSWRKCWLISGCLLRFALLCLQSKSLPVHNSVLHNKLNSFIGEINEANESSTI
jgi:phytoene synthase